MLVRDLMTPESKVITIEAGSMVSRAVALLMRHGIGALPVLGHDSAPVGVVAERDLVRAMHEQPERVLSLPVSQVMRRPAPTCGPGDAIQAVMARMTRDRMRHLIVCEKGRLVGVLSVGDLLKRRLEELEMEAGVLRDYVTAQRTRI